MAENILFTRVVRELTNWPDEFVGKLIGKSPFTVQGYRLERLPETLDEAQKAALVAELRAWWKDAGEQIDLLEMLA